MWFLFSCLKENAFNAPRHIGMKWGRLFFLPSGPWVTNREEPLTRNHLIQSFISFFHRVVNDPRRQNFRFENSRFQFKVYYIKVNRHWLIYNPRNLCNPWIHGYGRSLKGINACSSLSAALGLSLNHMGLDRYVSSFSLEKCTFSSHSSYSISSMAASLFKVM